MVVDPDTVMTMIYQTTSIKIFVVFIWHRDTINRKKSRVSDGKGEGEAPKPRGGS